MRLWLYHEEELDRKWALGRKAGLRHTIYLLHYNGKISAVINLFPVDKSNLFNGFTSPKINNVFLVHVAALYPPEVHIHPTTHNLLVCRLMVKGMTDPERTSSYDMNIYFKLNWKAIDQTVNLTEAYSFSSCLLATRHWWTAVWRLCSVHLHSRVKLAHWHNTLLHIQRLVQQKIR